MFKNFHHYCEIRLPKLYDALDKHILSLTCQIPVKEYGFLRQALNGGKKLRGILLGMLTEVLGGEWESALPRAVAVELIHAATLIHDDFVDRDHVRRHLPAVWTVEGARRAVLLGDVIFASAIHMMSEIGWDDGRVVSRAIAKISRGALMEPGDPVGLMKKIEAGQWEKGLYEKIIHLKTGVLFEAACELGAIAAGADKRIQKHCARYGSLTGEAYQIADDMKDIKKCLGEDSVHPWEMTLIVPSVLYFNEKARPYIGPLMLGKSSRISPSLRQCLETTLERMGQEIQNRLNRAADEIGGILSDKPHSDIGFEAPAALLDMFSLS